MSSSVVDTVNIIDVYSYATIVIITIVGYDYVLTLSREMDSVWFKPWTRVSVLFFIIRYVGLCWAIDLALVGGIFVPGPIKVSIAMLVVGDWGYMLFLAAADLVMILRVYALWGRSRVILGTLLCCFVPQVVTSAIWEILYTTPNRSTLVSITHTLNISTCAYTSYHAGPVGTVRVIPRYVLGALLLILAVIPTLRQTIQMYRLTKRLQTNVSMKLFLKEGTVYFVVNVLFNIVNEITLPNLYFMMFVNTISYALSCSLMPRFIINIRELYEKELRDRWKIVDSEIGTWVDPVGPTDTAMTVVDRRREGQTVESHAEDRDGFGERQAQGPIRS